MSKKMISCISKEEEDAQNRQARHEGELRWKIARQLVVIKKAVKMKI